MSISPQRFSLRTLILVCSVLSVLAGLWRWQFSVARNYTARNVSSLGMSRLVPNDQVSDFLGHCNDPSFILRCGPPDASQAVLLNLLSRCTRFCVEADELGVVPGSVINFELRAQDLTLREKQLLNRWWASWCSDCASHYDRELSRGWPATSSGPTTSPNNLP
jgi:hypothetical protein